MSGLREHFASAMRRDRNEVLNKRIEADIATVLASTPTKKDELDSLKALEKTLREAYFRINGLVESMETIDVEQMDRAYETIMDGAH